MSKLFTVPLNPFQPSVGDEITVSCNQGHPHRVRVVDAPPGGVVSVEVLDELED